MSWGVPGFASFDEMLAALCPGKANSEEGWELNPKSLSSKRCGALLEIDAEYHPSNGNIAYKVQKLIPLGDLETARERDDQAESDDDQDLF